MKNALKLEELAVSLYLTGLLTNNELLQTAGIILFGHSSMDRMFGYGLKHFEGFKYTQFLKGNFPKLVPHLIIDC